ncbi:hypothetical protein NDU88_003865 [Pleurodeles waltl]|uniref:Uncharacterized protein n=1 Tax=Pleurodeles waltl TaxID=8319 RepID=A0AAV7SH52_PLEWA|nr:hypothetical protein NDU88_003865 [Pleurodeles waltl]
MQRCPRVVSETPKDYQGPASRERVRAPLVEPDCLLAWRNLLRGRSGNYKVRWHRNQDSLVRLSTIRAQNKGLCQTRGYSYKVWKLRAFAERK